MTDPFSPAQLGPVTLRNRVIKAATSEGRSPAGLVTDDLIDFHRSFAEGGVGMTTVAYCCVSPEGASAPGQIVMDSKAIPGLRRQHLPLARRLRPQRRQRRPPRLRRGWRLPNSRSW